MTNTTERKNAFTSSFGEYIYVGDSISTDPDDKGRAWVARIETDYDMGEPWKEHDGHGIVSEWRRLDSKRPGERILQADRSHARFYDIQASIAKAKAEQWDAEPFGTGTPGERAARAVAADFQRMKDWCEDRWTWVGVVLSYTVTDEDGNEGTFDHVASLWGIESDSNPDYFTEIANDLLAEKTDDD